MKNSPRVRAAVKAVFADIEKVPDEELQQIENHQPTDLYSLLLHANVIWPEELCQKK